MPNSDRIKIVALLCSGRFQHYFLHQLQQRHELVGVVICEPPSTAHSGLMRTKHLLRYLQPFKLIKYLQSRLYLPRFEALTERRLHRNFAYFFERQEMPEGLNVLHVANINDPQVSEFIGALNIQMICVNGTNLIREPLLSQTTELQFGAINLHTGLSPYSRGGNCNLFMLLEDKPQLMGATVHYIDAGIDSGDIVASVQPDLQHDDPYEYIEAKIFIAGFDVMLACIEKIISGRAPRVKQWESGKLFLQRTGYRYEPYLRVLANRKIQAGLLRKYLSIKPEVDKDVKLVE